MDKNTTSPNTQDQLPQANHTITSIIHSDPQSNLNHSSQESKKAKQNLLSPIIDLATKCAKPTEALSTRFLASILSKDLREFMMLCAYGFPEEMKILRALAWKINLGLLPFQDDNWLETLTKKRKQYAAIKNIFTVKVSKEKSEYEKVKHDKAALIKFKAKSSNMTLMENIERDLDRTQMQFPTFFQPTDGSAQFTAEEIKNCIKERKEFLLYDMQGGEYQTGRIETNADVIARLLFYYSNYYPDVYYNQGMNEIISPIYYCYSFERAYYQKEDTDIEADTFWSFYELMEQLKHVFLRDEDNNEHGVTSKGNKLTKMLEIVDKPLSDHFAAVKVQFSFFSYRWFILLFAQDFGLEDIMKLWDLLFVKRDKFYYVYYFAIALIELKRPKLIDNALFDILQELQNFADIKLSEAIELTHTLNFTHRQQIDPFIQ